VSLAVALFCFSINLYLTRFIATVDNWLDDSVVYLTTEQGYSLVDFEVAKEIERQRPQVKALARFRIQPYRWKRMSDIMAYEKDEYFIQADTTMLEVLGLNLVAGSWNYVTETNLHYRVALTESFAKREFGTADEAIGQELWIGNMGYFRVGAVVEDMPYSNSISEFHYIAGWIFEKDDNFFKMERGMALVKLNEGVDPDDFIQSLYDIQEGSKGNKYKVYHFIDRARSCGIAASRKSSLMSDLNPVSFSIALLMTSLPGILILVVALFNYFHLLVNSILSGQRDYALRRVHGARTVDMWYMVSTQIILTTILTGIISLIITRYVTPLIKIGNSSGSGTIHFYIDVDVILEHTVQYIVMLIAVGLIIAWLAVIRVRGAETGNMIKRKYGGRNIMLGVQLTFAQLTITILVALLLNMRSSMRGSYSWMSKEDKKCIITDKKYYTPRTSKDMTLEMSYLESLPYITHVTSMKYEYLRTNGQLDVRCIIDGNCSNRNCISVFITPDIIDMLEVQIKDGRMPVESNEILVDDSFIEEIGLGVGDTVWVKEIGDSNDADEPDKMDDRTPFVITGHIGNLREGVEFYRDLKIHQATIYCNRKLTEGYIVVRCLPGHEMEARTAIAKYHYPDDEDSQVVIDYASSSLYDYLYRNNNIWISVGFIAWIVAIFAFIITLLGVYSAISIDTTRRRKEMAIRKINGARTRQVTMLFVQLYAKLFIISSAVSVPLSAWIIRYTILSDHPYDKGVGHALLFYLFILFVMALFVAITIGFKIRRIARENPADVIKSE
jgi:hypothetical protein